MAKIRLYHDTRANGGDLTKVAQVKVAICHRGSTSYIATNIAVLPSQWDPTDCKVVGHKERRTYNDFIRKRLLSVESAIVKVSDSTSLKGLTATQLRDAVLPIIQPESVKEPDVVTVAKYYREFLTRKKGRTKGIYEVTYRRLQAFLGKKFEAVKFEDISKAWLENFDAFMALTAPSANARGIHMRNLRAVFNDAIDNEVTIAYPFRRYKIRSEPTRKRSFNVGILRQIFSHECADEWQTKYRDWFTLTFMLIGINVADLFRLTEVSDGRVDYVRAKTHKPYSIKVEPECQALLDRYSGGKHLINYLDAYKNSRSFSRNLSTGLRRIKAQLGLSELTTYWARHSWATVAASLDIPKDTIAHALGHGSNTVTDIYIDFDMRKVDEANRKVLDYVLYGRDWRNPEPTPEPQKRKRGRPRKTDK